MKFLPFLLLLALLSTVQAAPTETEAALDRLNGSFRNQYALAWTENLATMPLVIVINTPKVTWISHGKKQEKSVPLTNYTQTKILLHAILGTYGIGYRLSHDGATAPEWEMARELRANIDTAIKLVPRTDISAADQKRLLPILINLRGEITAWLAAGSLTQKQLEASLRPVRKDAMVLVNEQGRVLFQNLCAVLREIRQGVPVADWEKAVLVVTGPAAPRRDRLEVAAAMAVLGRDALSHRIFYAENVFDDKGAIQLVASLEIDRHLAETLFDDPYRMWRDLLGDSVKDEVGGDFYPGLAD